MVTSKAIGMAFEMLQAAGIQNAPTMERPGEDEETYTRRVLLAKTVWQQCLDDLDDEELLHCVQAHLRDEEHCHYWPQPGRLLAHRRATLLSLSPDIAWGQVLEEVQLRGAWNGPPPRWSPTKEIDYAFNMGITAVGGWRAICMCEAKDIGYLAAAFRRAFEVSCGRATKGLPMLPERTGCGWMTKKEIEQDDARLLEDGDR